MKEILYLILCILTTDTMQFQSGNAEKTKEYTKHLPSGFVTYAEMKARHEWQENKVNASYQRENGQRKAPSALTFDKAETAQRHCESEKYGDDTMQFQSGNAEKTKEYIKQLPSGFVTYHEMRARLERRQNKFSASDQRENRKKEIPLALTLDKAVTRQRLRESKKNGDDTMTTDYKFRLPQGCVTLKEMEKRMIEKRFTINYSNDRKTERVLDCQRCCICADVMAKNNVCCCENHEIRSYQKTFVNENAANQFITYANESPKLMQKTAFCSTNSRTVKGISKCRDLIFENSKDDENKSTCDSMRRNNSISNKKTAYSSERKCSTQQIQDTVLYRRDVGNDRDDVVNEEDDRDETLLEDPRLAVSFPGRSAPFKIIIMNVNCPSGLLSTEPERRRHIIQALILKYTPALLLFQEFKWVGISGRTWKACPIPDQYYYQGKKEASMIHDKRLVTVDDLSTVMRRIFESLQRSSLNQLTAAFRLRFNPLKRMCSKLLLLRVEPFLRVICISWHGYHNGFDRREKIEYFKYLIEFFRNIYIEMNIPILIGGDFNIPMQYIEEYIPQPFKLHKYIASERRNRAGIIDFFITTNELHLTNTRFVDLKTLKNESDPTDILDHDPNKILDHDPVYTVLSNEE